MLRPTRPISWINAARKDFAKFPIEAQWECRDALTIAAEGGKSELAKPLTGFGSGVFEIALTYKGDAFRVVYAVLLNEDVWVSHAFQKKSKHGIQTPKPEIDLIKEPIKRLKEAMK